MATRQWHYVRDGKQAGPVGEEVLKRMAASGALGAGDLVWSEGFAEWVPAGQVAGIFLQQPARAAGRAAAPTAPADEEDASSPYAAPKVQVSSATYGGDGDVITTGIKRALAETRPWVFFMSILVFIGCGLAAIVSLIALVVSPIVGLVQLAFIALYFFAGYHLFNYASGIRSFLRTSRASDLTAALTAQKSFWKLVGIVTAVGLVLWLLSIVVLIASGAGIQRAMMQD